MKKIILLIAVAVAAHSCKEPAQAEPDYIISVGDDSGAMQVGAEVRLFHSVADLKANVNPYFVTQTNGDGWCVLPEGFVTDSLICLAQKGPLTSKFKAFKYTAPHRAYNVIVSQPEELHLLCGYGSKQWLMTSYSINGTPQSYVVTSTLNDNGTWSDTNGNAGTWHFENNHTQLVYDYTSGLVVTFDVLELTEGFIKLKGNQSGNVIDMEMTAV